MHGDTDVGRTAPAAGRPANRKAFEDLVGDVLGADADPRLFAARTFAELGGTPLLAVRCTALAQERLALCLPPRALLGDAPLADVLARAASASGDDRPADVGWERISRFWLTHLSDVPELELPGDGADRGADDASVVRSPLDLGPGTAAAIRARVREADTSEFAFLLASFALTLSRWTGARSLLVGVPLPEHRATGQAAPGGVNAAHLVPVRVDIADDGGTGEFLRAVHRSLELSTGVGALHFPGQVHPLIQVGFGARIACDLSLAVHRSGQCWAGLAECALRVWSQDALDGFTADFHKACEELSGPDRSLADVRCISADRRRLLDSVNETGRDFPDACLDELFRSAVRRAPEAVAVRDGTTELTYRQLAGAAAEQARRLRRSGVRPGDAVLVGLPRSAAEVVAVLGTAWAGAVYVGIDPSAPPGHLAAIVEKCAPAAQLMGHQEWGLGVPGVPVVDVWEPAWPTSAHPPLPAGPTDPERPAYIAFTSGSTGAPKGVCVPHRAVVRLALGAQYVRLGPGERMLRLSPLAFDASTFEIWAALLTGTALEVYPEQLPSPTELGGFLIERKVTIAWLTAGLFRLMADFSPAALGGLRNLLTGGDVVPHDHVRRILQEHPGLTITNGYGPTENTTFTTTHSVASPESARQPLPIGVPVPGTHVHVLDASGRRVPPGAVGELHAAGAGLALGYLGDAAETARCFGRFSPEVPERLYRTGDLVRMDARGRLHFVGRTDDQVKIRGYRVEPGAISEALSSCPGVQEAVVFAAGADNAIKRLVAAVVPAANAEVDVSRLRGALTERLPLYMVPALWTVVHRLPVTRNGKVDRKALAAAAVPVQ